MEQVVSVVRAKGKAVFVLHPLGTFLNYGGHVGISPYVELPANIDATALGRAVLELLELSVATGYSIREIEQYRKDTLDDDSARIRAEHFGTIRSTKDTDRRFLQSEVSTNKKKRHWLVTKLALDKEQGILIPEKRARVSKQGDPSELGQVLIGFLHL